MNIKQLLVATAFVAAASLGAGSASALTTYGEPLTATRLNRYLLVAGGVGLAVWAARDCTASKSACKLALSRCVLASCARKSVTSRRKPRVAKNVTSKHAAVVAANCPAQRQLLKDDQTDLV